MPQTLLDAATANVNSDSSAAVTLFAANTSASQRMVFNDSTAILYLKFGSAASATSHTVQVAAGGFYELPVTAHGDVYRGLVTGRWSATNGAARTTEVY